MKLYKKEIFGPKALSISFQSSSMHFKPAIHCNLLHLYLYIFPLLSTCPRQSYQSYIIQGKKYTFLQCGVIPAESCVFSDRVGIKLALMLIEPTKQKLHSGGGQSFKQVWLVPQSFFMGPIGKVPQELRQFVLQRCANSTSDYSLSHSGNIVFVSIVVLYSRVRSFLISYFCEKQKRNNIYGKYTTNRTDAMNETDATNKL